MLPNVEQELGDTRYSNFLFMLRDFREASANIDQAMISGAGELSYEDRGEESGQRLPRL